MRAEDEEEEDGKEEEEEEEDVEEEEADADVAFVVGHSVVDIEDVDVPLGRSSSRW